MSDRYGLVLPFDTDDPQFRRGVEIGVLQERLRWCNYAGMTVHADCAEMIIRMAEARGLPFSAEPWLDGWLNVKIGWEVTDG